MITKDLLKKEDPFENKIFIADILRKNSNNSYLVRDIRGRDFLVNGSNEYTVGQTVSIKKGIILGRTKNLVSFKEYVV